MLNSVRACSSGIVLGNPFNRCDLKGKRCKPTTPTGLPHVQRCSALPDKSAAVVSGEGVHYISRFGIANRQITQKTDPGIALYDITPKVQAILSECGLKEGCINLFVPNTTAALAVNEYEPRLLEDLKIFLRKFAPAGDGYLHDDIPLRESPDGWPGGWKAWADQEPENAQAHIQSMFLGNTQSIPVVGGKLTIGEWQSIILFELDGARTRTVRIQAIGEMG